MSEPQAELDSAFPKHTIEVFDRDGVRQGIKVDGRELRVVVTTAENIASLNELHGEGGEAELREALITEIEIAILVACKGVGRDIAFEDVLGRAPSERAIKAVGLFLE